MRGTSHDEKSRGGLLGAFRDFEFYDPQNGVRTVRGCPRKGLDGIRPKVAERIVAYREAHGPFKKPEDLKKVEGVGKAMFERNRERVITK